MTAVFALLSAGCGGTSESTTLQDQTDETEKPVWKEATSQLPEYPRQQDLLPVALESRNQHFIDGRSLSRLSDGVVRYTIVIRSPSGVDNVFYEGLRCETNEFKPYAYGVGGRWREMQDPQWRRTTNRGTRSYTAVLRETYMCDSNRWPLRPKHVRKRLQQGGWDAGTPAYDPP